MLIKTIHVLGYNCVGLPWSSDSTFLKLPSELLLAKLLLVGVTKYLSVDLLRVAVDLLFERDLVLVDGLSCTWSRGGWSSAQNTPADRLLKLTLLRLGRFGDIGVIIVRDR